MKTIIFFGYIIMFFLFLSCHNKSKKIEETSVKFDKTIHDFGKYKWKRDVKKKVFFKYLNTGNNPLIIKDIKTSCGCTIPNWNRRPVLPNKSDSIEVMYDSRTLGFFYKTITVFYNGKNPAQQLIIEGEVTFP
jgi:hypothetical protein